MKGEKGISLLETILALAIMGIISAAFLAGTATTSTARVASDERGSGKVLAESLMENIKKLEYAPSYNVTVPDEFAGYSANITVLNIKNNNIQQIYITIERRDREVYTLESYKVNRQ